MASTEFAVEIPAVSDASPSRRGAAVRAESALQARVALLIDSLGSGAELARLLDVHRGQPSQWSKGNEQPAPRTIQLLLDLDYVVAKARQAWSGRAAIDWLTGSCTLLDGARPIDVLKASGSTPVVQALDVAMA
ncbi:hypothetical protein [Rathayibacter rathayi]|uniref:hypothetical protein n=1 Tax=Rathayibacter rathayi TaxID=33887 RepID=UPI000CE84BDF|nr:hypothetical protein [Rathayibacter rathayi]PPF26101.1 hypothetical protein C5C34_01350 [Rathayibacter rathayi]PPG88665.1 hypothetical protein C5C47_06965 [Rathayibacter rathayi]PPG97225.1 hypothetical protein C5C00_07495 [Rathayibacter rathayi]